MGKGTSKAGTYLINNPPGVPKNAITQEEFLALRGVSSPMSDFLVDKLRGNRQLRTASGAKRFQAEADAARESYSAQRQAAINEYKSLIASGKIQDKTSIERSLTTAQSWG